MHKGCLVGLGNASHGELPAGMPAHTPYTRQFRMHCCAPMFTQKALSVPAFRQLPLLLSSNL